MEDRLLTVAFYNVENFYSKTSTMQQSFLPSNFTKWVDQRYAIKVDRIAHAISQIGYKETNKLPTLIGLSEVENEDVLKDLISSKRLVEGNYDYVFFPSLDERNINVCCLYRKDYFRMIKSEPLRIVFQNNIGEKSYTRDILYLETEFSGEKIYFFIVHLPSKLDQEVNQQKRKILLSKIRTKIDEILCENTAAKIMVMGDFNDTPTADNIRLELDTRPTKDEVKKRELYNPMVSLMSYKRGSLIHRKQWMLFDQILLSNGFLTKNSEIKYLKTDIFDAMFLTTNDDKQGGYPLRTFVGSKYLGGYSDHFPVFTILKY